MPPPLARAGGLATEHARPSGGVTRSGRRLRRSTPLAFALLGTVTLSFTAFRAGEVLISDVLFLIAACLIFVKMLTGNDRDLAPADARKGSTIIVVGATLLLTAGTLSSLRSWEPVESVQIVLRFGWVTLVWFWILRTVCRDREDLKRLVRAWKASAIISSIAAVLGMMGIAFVSTHGSDRQVGLTAHPNHLAGQLAAAFMFLLLAVPAAEGGNGRRANAWWLVALGLSSTALFATGSMTGLLAVAGGCAAAGVGYLMTRTPDPSRRRSPLAPLLVLLILVGGSLAMFTSDLPVMERIRGYREGDAGVNESVEARSSRNSLVLSQFDHFLVIGFGFHAGSASRTYVDPRDPSNRNYRVHNMYLSLLYQAGLAAVVGVIVILTTAARQLAALLRRLDPELYRLALALLGSFTAVIITSMFQPTTFDRYFWMPVGMIGCLWAVRRRELRQEAGSPAAVRAVADEL
jgi:hypothetical protein